MEAHNIRRSNANYSLHLVPQFSGYLMVNCVMSLIRASATHNSTLLHRVLWEKRKFNYRQKSVGLNRVNHYEYRWVYHIIYYKKHTSLLPIVTGVA